MEPILEIRKVAEDPKTVIFRVNYNGTIDWRNLKGELETITDQKTLALAFGICISHMVGMSAEEYIEKLLDAYVEENYEYE
jgi:hypothetical protein